MSNELRNIWLFGCGYWAKILVQKIHSIYPESSIFVVDINQKNLQHFVQIRPFCRASSKKEFLESVRSEDLCFIATPPNTHSELITLALSNNCHCWVEKPMTTSSKEALELISLAKKKQLTLFIDNTFLYDPLIQELKRATLNSGTKKIYSRRQGWGRVLTDFGVLWDLLPHDLSIINNIFGKISSWKLQSMAFGPKDLQLDLTLVIATIIFITETGFEVTVELSAISQSKVREIQIISDLGLTSYNLNQEGSQIIFTPWNLVPGVKLNGVNKRIEKFNVTDSLSNAIRRFDYLVSAKSLEHNIDYTISEIEIIEKLHSESLSWGGIE